MAKELRKMEFGDHENNNLRMWATQIRDITIDEIIRLLAERNPTANYLETDNNIFNPFIDIYVTGLIIHPFESFFRDLGTKILEEVLNYETDKNVKVNKEHLFFALSITSIKIGDEITSMFYWEKAQKENAHTTGGTTNVNIAITAMGTKFRSVLSPIEHVYANNNFIALLKPRHAFILTFEEILNRLTGLNQAHFLSCGIKHVHVLAKLRDQDNVEIVKIFAQELLNSLCILNENLLKTIGLNGTMIGPLMNDIPNRNSAVGAVLGLSGNSSGMYRISKTDFYSRYNDYITYLEANTLPNETLMANTLYAMHRIRNEALHTLDDTRLYYSDKELFEKTIGLLLINISTILNL